MPPQPLTADWRLEFQYTVLGFTHKHHEFLDVVPSADPMGHSTVPVNGGTTQGVSLLVDPFFTAWETWFSMADADFVGAVLQQYNAGSWDYVAFHATSVSPANEGTTVKSSMWDVSGKTNPPFNIHAYMYEGVFGVGDKETSYAAQNTPSKALIDYFFNTGSGALATAAYYWATSKSGAPRDRWLAIVADTNEKLRRLRRIK